MYRSLNPDGLGITARQSELIELALSFGFQGMDLDMREFVEQVEVRGLDHARRLIDSARIRISQFRLPVLWEGWEENEAQYKADLEKLPGIAKLAAELGCTRTVTSITPACDQRPYHENFELHRKRLVELTEILEPHQIRLGLEFQAPAELRKGRAFQFIHTLSDLVQLARSVSSSHIGVVVDLWQLHVGGFGVEQLKDLATEQVVAVVVSDAPADANLEEIDSQDRLWPSETGVVDAPAALAALAEIGFDGPVTVRVGRESVRGLGREAIVRSAKERIDQVWKAAGLDPRGKLPAAAHG